MSVTSFRPDDPWPDNAWFNAQLRLARRNRIASVAAGLELIDGGLSKVQAPRIWAKITGSGPAYGFAESTPNLAGGFDALTGGRTDDSGRQPAYEANGVAGLAGTYQRLRFSAAGDWRFQDVAGGAGQSNTGGTVEIPTCNCPMPTTLTMTSADPNCNYGMFQNATLVYGAAPSCFAGLHLGNIFISTSSFTDRITGVPFYYWLYCQYNQYSLTRLYCESPYGSPYRDAALYSWLVGGYGNNCSPFYLHNGSAYPGSDASCSVKIDPGG